MTGAPFAEWLNTLAESTRPRLCSLWGSKYRVKPVLISSVFGDGRQLMWLEPINDRPAYYLVRVDSKCICSNWEGGEEKDENFCDLLDDISDAIRAEFGDAHETYEHDNGRTYTRNNPWPSERGICEGSRWGTMARLNFLPVSEVK